MLTTHLYRYDERGVRARALLEAEAIPILEVITGMVLSPALRLCTAGRPDVESVWTPADGLPEIARCAFELLQWRADESAGLPARKFVTLRTIPQVVCVAFNLDDAAHVFALRTMAQTGTVLLLRYDGLAARPGDGGRIPALGMALGAEAMRELSEALTIHTLMNERAALPPVMEHVRRTGSYSN